MVAPDVPARAEAPSDARRVAAKQSWNRAQKYFADGDNAAALRWATSAYEAVPTPKIALGRAMILTEMGQHDAAFEVLVVARSLLRKGEEGRAVDAAIAAAGRRTEPPMAVLLVRDVPGGAMCRLGDATWVCLARSVGVAAGRHELSIEAAGHQPAIRVVTVSAGQVTWVTASLAPAPGEKAPAPPEPEARLSATEVQERAPNILAWTLVGGGVALAGGAALAYVLALDDHSQLESLGRAPGGAGLGRYEELVDARDTKLTVSYVLLGVGAAAVIGGVVAFVLEPTSPTEPDAQLRISPTDGGALVGGAWQF